MTLTTARRAFAALASTLALTLAAAAPALASAAPHAAAAEAANAFGFDLYGALVAAAPDENLVVSGASVELALAMTLAGARGRTAEQMAAVLHAPERDPHAAFGALCASLGDDRGAGVTLAVANRLWAQAGAPLEAPFTRTLAASYGAGVVTVDFAATEPVRRRINAWVARETRQQIRDLVPPGVLGATTRLVLTNAVYLRGAWETGFDAAATVDAPFEDLDGGRASVRLMRRRGELAHAVADVGGGDAADVVKLPFRGGRVAMILLVPRSRRGLPALEAAAPAGLDAWLARLAPADVALGLPRLDLATKKLLPTALRALGMVDAFDAVRADLSGIDGRRGLVVSDVIHQAALTVDEAGAEAAAATAVVIAEADAGPTPGPVVVTADHPFLLVLRDEVTGVNLFLARVVAP
ncbi:MAG: serpin family protein [Myxococcales bacterium]|nr:serpin family protein [Myxococcales bacterium]